MDLPVLPPRQHIVELLGGGGRVPEHLVLLNGTWIIVVIILR